MLCPVCKDVRLEIAERKGIEIDYCPQCRGIWLDRGELDKIIERSVAELQQFAPEPSRPTQTASEYRYADKPQHRQHKRRKGFLSELFEDFWD